MRTLVEVLKEILLDTNIEFIRGDEEATDECECGDTKHTKHKKDDNDEKHKSKKKTTDVVKTKQVPFSGLKILAVSADKTVLIHLKLDACQFTEFECKRKSYEIGVNLVLLNKMFKAADKEEELEMYVDDNEKQTLVLSVSNSVVGRKSEYKLKLMDIEPTIIKLPPVEPDVMITLSASVFNALCKNLVQMGSVLEITCTSNTVIFKCEGNNVTTETKYIDNENGAKILFMNKNKQLIIQGMYELKHLNLFSKCTSLSTDVQLLMMVQKYPLCIKYTVATLGTFTACISPIDSTAKNTFDEVDSLYHSEEEDDLKKDLDDNE
jgi:proliferating cell nuclear antigen